MFDGDLIDIEINHIISSPRCAMNISVYQNNIPIDRAAYESYVARIRYISSALGIGTSLFADIQDSLGILNRHSLYEALRSARNQIGPSIYSSTNMDILLGRRRGRRTWSNISNDEAGSSSGFVQSSSPETINYDLEQTRIKSFSTWPAYLTEVGITAEKLSDAGLYYGGLGDQTFCFSCSAAIQDWKPEQDAIYRHASSTNACQYLEKVKFINFETFKCDRENQKNEKKIPSSIVEVENILKQCICEELSCRICFSERINCILKPCLHSSTCSKCSISLEVCPFCREKIDSFTPLFCV